MSDITAAAELDCRGLNCPLPVLKTKKAIVKLSSGEVIKVTATDPGAVADFESFSKRTGHQLLDHSESDGEFVFYLRRA